MIFLKKPIQLMDKILHPLQKICCWKVLIQFAKQSYKIQNFVGQKEQWHQRFLQSQTKVAPHFKALHNCTVSYQIFNERIFEVEFFSFHKKSSLKTKLLINYFQGIHHHSFLFFLVQTQMYKLCNLWYMKICELKRLGYTLPYFMYYA